MSKHKETIAAIIAEMRLGFDQSWHGIDREWAHGLADRLEAALVREKAAIEADALAVGGMVEASRATAEKSSTVGNAAKLREAVKCLMDNLNIHLMMPSEHITINRAELEAMVKDCSEALSAPPRNCDVGTEEEQAQRFDRFCDANKYVGDDGANWCSPTCPCYNALNCGVKWAQMPYEEGVKVK